MLRQIAGYIFFVMFLGIIPISSYSQIPLDLTGRVVNKTTGTGIEMVAIQIRELNRWTTSDEKGFFVFENIPAGQYTLQANCLGFELYEMRVTLKQDITDFKLMLKEMSLGLDEIVVVAKENTDLSSSSKIENTALEHVQATSLSDVMQLVPGQITLNPNMSRSNQITIRDINSKENPAANAAMGTSIVLNGSPLSNDANMQTLNTASGGTAQSASTAGQGIDLRQISTDNIESIEVIRGIPSVEYGELTTGAVLVKTKSGKTPWNARLKADPKIKQMTVSKGFMIPGRNIGAVNVDLDFTKAYDDLRKPAESYRRLTGQLGYSNTFFKHSTPLSLNANFSLYRTLDMSKSDPDMIANEKSESEEKCFRFNLYGNWMVKKSWLTNIAYNFSGDFVDQYSYEYKIVTNSGVRIMPTATVSGESEVAILPSNYYGELTIDGRQYNYFGSVKANLTDKYGSVNNSFMIGTEWRSSGNNGDGQIYDSTRPPSGAFTARPRAFKDIPARHQLALYAEDKIIVPIGKTKLKTQVGLRYNNLLPKGLFDTDGFTTLEPRLNISYAIIEHKRNQLLKDLNFRFGYGRTSKAPSMIFLSPDDAYIDEISFNYYPDLIIATTNVFRNGENSDLKPMTNKKIEAGVDFKIARTKVVLTAFKEKIRDGFSWEKNFFVMTYRVWDQLEGQDKAPRFENGNIYYQDGGETKLLGYSTDTKFNSYRLPVNNYMTDKKGLEYVVDFGNLSSLKSSLNVTGAYYNITRYKNVIPFPERQGISYQGQDFPYLPLFPGNRGLKSERLNSNFNIITHIPKLRLVTSLCAQVIWIDRYRQIWTDGDDRSVAYSVGDNGEKLYGQYDGVDKIRVDPIGFYDKSMAYHEWQDSYTSESPYDFMIKELDNDYFSTEDMPVRWQINLKLTKEIGNHLKLAFFANNLLNYRPKHQYINKNYTRLNQPSYFGAELKLAL